LLDSAQGVSGREVGRLAGVSHVAAARALRRLEASGIVERLGAGATQLFRLNSTNTLVSELLRPLLLKERETYASLMDLIRSFVQGSETTVIVFGSAARQEESAASDLDLLFLVPRGGDRSATQEAAADLTEQVHRRFGFRASPLVLTPGELQQLDQRGDPLIAAIRQEGVLVAGRNIEEVLHDPADRPSES
jgi:predicted nucleotidyltransferase